MAPKAKSDPTAAILQLLRDKNRPYSIINIGDELHGEYGKTAITKAVEALASSGEITCKLCGKSTKLYFASQDGLPIASEEELAEMDASIESLRQQEQELKQHVEELRQKRNRLLATRPIPEMITYIDELKTQLSQASERKEELMKSAEGITPETAEQNVKMFRLRCEQWRVRRNKCLEIMDSLCEACDKKRRQFIEELDLETDESNYVKLDYRDKTYKVTELI